MAAKYERVRTAGEELFITASAVSHQIRRLEQELNQPLLERSRRELRLTDRGRALYEQIAPLIAQIDLVLRHPPGRSTRHGAPSPERSTPHGEPLGADDSQVTRRNNRE